MLGKLKGLVKDRRGNIAVFGALTLPFFIGGIAFGTEAGYWLVQKTQLSFSTDAAAISAGQLYNRGVTEKEIYETVRGKLVADGYPDSSLFVDIAYPTETSDLMTVRSAFQADKYFSQVLWDGQVVVRSHTIVAINGKSACLLALNKSASGAVTTSGSSKATLDGCIVASNSKAADSIYLGGSTTMKTDCMVASGGIDGEENATTICQKNLTYRRDTKDPFAKLTQPRRPAGAQNR